MDESQIQMHKLFVQQDTQLYAGLGSGQIGGDAIWFLDPALRKCWQSSRQKDTAIVSHCECHHFSSVLTKTAEHGEYGRPCPWEKYSYHSEALGKCQHPVSSFLCVLTYNILLQRPSSGLQVWWLILGQDLDSFRRQAFGHVWVGVSRLH